MSQAIDSAVRVGRRCDVDRLNCLPGGGATIDGTSRNIIVGPRRDLLCDYALRYTGCRFSVCARGAPMKICLMLLALPMFIPWMAGCSSNSSNQANQADDNRPDYFNTRPVYDNSPDRQRQFEKDN
jgi:hypothetical protein